jgi:23S rRNA (uracil1939-C5)-methyltransferase
MARRRRRKPLPKDPIQVTIESLSHDGRGVTHIDGKTLFVSGALAGETVDCVYTNKRSKFDEAKTVCVHQANEQRVEPRCRFYELCGGCSLQHLDTQAQIEHKQSILAEQLQHFGKVKVESWLEPLTDDHWSYRRKARLGVKFVHKKESVLVGFRERQSAFITDIDYCEVLDERVAKLIAPLREMIATLDAKQTIPQIEVACGDSEVALVFRHLEDLSEADLAQLISFSETQEISLYTQSGGPKTVVKQFPNDGKERLVYELEQFALTMHFHPMDFTQVNQGINTKMMARAMELLAPTKEERVLDLFCGLGNFSLPIATLAKEVVAVEGDQAMVERGTENAQLNKLENISFHQADLQGDFYNAPWASEGFDKLLIDPPRSGAFEICEHLHKFNAKSIVYVSCNPATLARDAEVLTKHGYKLVTTGVMDMFPHTAHVESIALFEKI